MAELSRPRTPEPRLSLKRTWPPWRMTWQDCYRQGKNGGRPLSQDP